MGELAHTRAVRQGIDPYPLAEEVKLLWDRQERTGVIMPFSMDDNPPGEAIVKNIKRSGRVYQAHLLVTAYGDIMQAVHWAGEEDLGYWSPEYLLPKDFDFTKRPSVTITRHSMYVIDYSALGRVIKEGFLFIKLDDEYESGE